MIDKENSLFQCRIGSSIHLDKFNDGKCDCCDCSDELLNEDIVQINKCSLPEKIQGLSQLRQIYRENIRIRNKILNQNQQKINKLKNKIDNLEKERLKEFQNYNHTIQDLKEAKENLRKWAYQTLGLKVPTPESIAKQKEEYINKETTYHYITTESNDDEEGEDFSESLKRIPQESEYEIQERRERRAKKFDLEQKEKYKEIIRLAAEQTKPHGSFLSRLVPDGGIPNEIQAVDQMKINMRKAKARLQAVEMKKSKLEVHMKYIDQGPLWYKAHQKTFKGQIANSEGNIYIILFHFANAVLPQGQKDLGQLYSFNKTNVKYIDDRNIGTDGLRPGLNAHLICSGQDQILSVQQISPSRYEAFIGLPEACEETFTEEGFTQFVSEMSPFVDKILLNVIEL